MLDTNAIKAGHKHSGPIVFQNCPDRSSLAMTLLDWSTIDGVGAIPFIDYTGKANYEWFVDTDDGTVWINRSWLCKPTNAPKYILSARDQTHPNRSNIRLVPATGCDVVVKNKSSPLAKEIRSLIADFRSSLGTAVSDWLLRSKVVKSLQMLPSKEAVCAALKEAGYADIIKSAVDIEASKEDFYNLHVSAIKSALLNVVADIGTQAPLGRYTNGEKDIILSNLNVSCRHWHFFLNNRRSKSVKPGESRDKSIMALMRRWNRWRPYVIKHLDSIQEAVANIYVGGTSLAKVMCVDSVESVIPLNPSLLDLVRGGTLILSIRAMVKWKKNVDEEKNIDNCHLRAMFTTERGGGGDKDRNPGSYSIMYALKRALPEHRKELELRDFYNHVVCEGFVKRLELAPIPKRLPHPLTWLWYCVQLEKLFWKEVDRNGHTFDAAQRLRMTIVCQLSGVVISPTRSEEPASLVMPGVGCKEPTCDVSDCHSNQVVLDDRPDYSYIIESHGKWDKSATHAHEIAIPESLAKLFRQWFEWGRSICMADADDHGFVMCSSTGKKLDSAYTIYQALRLLKKEGVDVSDWGELATVRDVRTSCLQETPGKSGLAFYINEAVRLEQTERGEPANGLQGGMSDEQLMAVWKLLIQTGRTSQQQVSNHYNKTTMSHTQMAELLELVRKHFVQNETSPPVRTEFVEKTGRRFPKTSAKKLKM